MTRSYYVPMRMGKIKKLTIPRAGKDAEQLGLSCVAGGNIKWYRHSGKAFSNFLKS